jgi:hypothetical protein
MNLYHTTTHIDTTYRWQPDMTAAAHAMKWVARKPQLFRDEIEAMATYFPHWMLVGAMQDQPTYSRCCAAPIVPIRGEMRCLLCNTAQPCDGLVWMGQLPTLARPEPGFRHPQAALRAAGFGEARVNQFTYLLVPMTVTYPGEWNNVEPGVRYSAKWLDTIGLPRQNGSYHLIANGRACLFGYGDWYAMTVCDVLQQRVVNHISSMLKIVAGQPSRQAFIGRAHA